MVNIKKMVNRLISVRFVTKKSQGKLMALKLEDKKLLVKEVNAVAVESISAVAAEYRGLSVADMSELRVEARNSGVYLRVVKNTLARLAIKGTDFECIEESLKGPIMLAFTKDDPGAAARVVKKFSKEHEELKAVSLVLDGKLLPATDISKLAELPTQDQARAMLLGILASPATQLLRLLNEPASMLSRTMSARGNG